MLWGGRLARGRLAQVCRAPAASQTTWPGSRSAGLASARESCPTSRSRPLPFPSSPPPQKAADRNGTSRPIGERQRMLEKRGGNQRHLSQAAISMRQGTFGGAMRFHPPCNEKKWVTGCALHRTALEIAEAMGMHCTVQLSKGCFKYICDSRCRLQGWPGQLRQGDSEGGAGGQRRCPAGPEPPEAPKWPPRAQAAGTSPPPHAPPPLPPGPSRLFARPSPGQSLTRSQRLRRARRARRAQGTRLDPSACGALLVQFPRLRAALDAVLACDAEISGRPVATSAGGNQCNLGAQEL